jgi:hypothetical protein
MTMRPRIKGKAGKGNEFKSKDEALHCFGEAYILAFIRKGADANETEMKRPSFDSSLCISVMFNLNSSILSHALNSALFNQMHSKLGPTGALSDLFKISVSFASV